MSVEAAAPHDHVFLGEHHDRNARRTLWVVGLTGVMMVAEIVAGFAFNSMALLADGFHMATHAGALAVAAAAYAYARRHAQNPRFSFGTGKVGELAGFASAMILGVFALGIAWESVTRLFEVQTVAFDQAILVAVAGLAVNLVSALLLGHGHDHPGHHHDHHDHHDQHHDQHHDHHHDHDHDHGHGHHHPAHAGQDNNLRSAYLHVLADALTSVLAIVALLAGRFLGWVWLDAAMGVVGALVIGRWSLSLMRDTAAVLLDQTDHEVAAEVRRRVSALGGQIVDLHVWRVGPAACAAIVSVSGLSAQAARGALRDAPGVRHLTVEALP
ncbi:CDF family Co(II)/Ni(II) efflux transporter DmeF [Phenylobacterium sp.]|uniref:CDF family Co(II)/Ni(II) efflux transporter DmeF n=1 Tax=Phenylobacterium sp. TaxID=1871053 RepID=UPI002623BB81|nr:CDF family Co(II)/Ni(II) efflux transporter DmeF [Phenylobacterium sp.]